MSLELSRREFLSDTATVTIAALVPQPRGTQPAVSGVGGSLPVTRIHKVYLAKPVPTWPKPDLDVPAEVKRIDERLAGLAGKMEGVRLEGGNLYRLPADVPQSASELGNPDGLLIFNLTSTVSAHLQRLVSIGLPTALFSQPFSGHDWSIVPRLRQEGQRIICLSTSDFNEIPGACRLIQTVHLLRNTRVVYVNEKPFDSSTASRIKAQLGVDVVHAGPDRVNAAYQAVDEALARAEAREWISGAVKVVEPSEQDIANSGRLYLALRRIMEEERAQAVTINCLGLFAAKRLPAYPCLAFCKLNDLGLTGVCEGDMESTLTQVIFTYAFGIPGFVSDPVIDTSNNTVIHAHCVSATRMEGPAGPRAPYIVRTHMEDNKGASLQVKMRVGQVITAAKLLDLDPMLISTGTITDNPESDRGCRTKITTRVSDARKLLNQYTGGLHRVIFYGDRVAAVKDLAALLRFRVVEEC